MAELEAEVSQRLGRDWVDIQAALCELFDAEWDDVAVIIETSATKSERSHVDVICDLIGRTDRKPTVRERVRKGVINWIGKPWRERPNPWDRYRDRLPEPPKVKGPEAADLEEWTPQTWEDEG